MMTQVFPMWCLISQWYSFFDTHSPHPILTTLFLLICTLIPTFYFNPSTPPFPFLWNCYFSLSPPIFGSTLSPALSVYIELKFQLLVFHGNFILYYTTFTIFYSSGSIFQGLRMHSFHLWVLRIHRSPTRPPYLEEKLSSWVFTQPNFFLWLRLVFITQSTIYQHLSQTIY